MKQDILNLTNQIKRYNHLYHNLGQTEISDQKYDQILQALMDLRGKHPKLNKITNLVGAPEVSTKKVFHKAPMLSLDNTYDQDKIPEFQDKLKKRLNQDQELEFHCSPKVDGISLELVYEKGNLVEALTRGDGFQGVSVLKNAGWIPEIPLKVKKDFTGDIRGEVFILKKHEDLHKEKTLRAAALNLLKGKNSSRDKLRHLNFICHGIGYNCGVQLNTFTGFEQFLRESGFYMMFESSFNKLCTGASQALSYFKHLSDFKRRLPFEADGVVMKLNSFMLQKKLGNGSRAPRWAFACKFKAD